MMEHFLWEQNEEKERFGHDTLMMKHNNKY